MGYTALYRKWRPKGFDRVIGQEHIVKTLKNQIITGRIGHAYLFCGTRGTGKTSTAKLFAKAINCKNPQNGEACGECEICRNISEGKSMNVIEIDAASNNGVDNIRDIREEVKYPPTEGKYKVYIIDEVHMLSIGASNALLKTLEEPPEHVVFILATTDPQKILVTILSRCQRYDFKRISLNDMTKELSYYMEQENINISQEALNYIARISEGAMRDALSILEQCISFYYGEEITLEKVLETVGAVDNKVFFEITDALIEKNTDECMKIVDDIIQNGRDIKQFVSELIVHFRNLLVVKNSQNLENILDLSKDNIQKLSEQSENITTGKLMMYIKEFSSLEVQLKYSSNERIITEVLLLKLCQEAVQQENINLSEEYKTLINRLNKLEKSVASGIAVKTMAVTKENPKETVKKIVPKAVAADLKSAVKLWENVKQEFKSESSLNALLFDTKAGYLDGDIYYIRCTYPSSCSFIEKEIPKIAEKLEEKTGKVFTIRTISEEDFKSKYNDLYGISNDENSNYEGWESVMNNINMSDVNYEEF